jgi:L-threonylcarbamoyladenylate synthase
MIVVKPSRPNIALVRSILKRGGIAAIPTETFYGLCANAENTSAVRKLLKIKERSHSKGLPIAVRSVRQLYNYVVAPNRVTRKLIAKFWPGPLTLIFKNKKLPEIIEGDKKSIAARIPSGKIISLILKKIDFPLTVTSANISGQSDLKSAQAVNRKFGSKLDVIIDGGQINAQKPSTIMDTRTRKAIILREGVIKADEINRFLGNL